MVNKKRGQTPMITTNVSGTTTILAILLNTTNAHASVGREQAAFVFSESFFEVAVRWETENAGSDLFNIVDSFYCLLFFILLCCKNRNFHYMNDLVCLIGRFFITNGLGATCFKRGSFLIFFFLSVS